MSKKVRVLIIGFFTLLMCGLSIDIIPDLLKKPEDFKVKTGYLFSTKIETYDYEIKGKKFKGEILVLQLSDESEFRLSNEKYRKELLKNKYLGKKIKIWMNDHNPSRNPPQIEIDNKLIYKVGEDKDGFVIILLTTILLIIAVLGVLDIFKDNAVRDLK